jgi:hypothetical protein
MSYNKEELQMDEDAEEWNELVEIEPAPGRLLDRMAAADTGEPTFCAQRAWARDFKQRLYGLVGFRAKKDDDQLRSSAAYELATRTCFAALPPCRGNCGCDDAHDERSTVGLVEA